MALLYSIGLVSVGAALGALARWGLGCLLNPLFSFLALGTLVANYLGCFIAGLLLGWTLEFSTLSEEWRLFLLTGFLGALTTFSTYSLEVIENMIQGRWFEGIIILVLHLVGALLCTVLGVFCYRLLAT